MVAILPKRLNEKSFKNTEADLSVGFSSYPPSGGGYHWLLYQPQKVRQQSVNRTLAERFLKGQDVAEVNVYIDGFQFVLRSLETERVQVAGFVTQLPNPPPVSHDPRNQVLHFASECGAQYTDFGSRSGFVHPCIEDNSESHNQVWSLHARCTSRRSRNLKEFGWKDRGERSGPATLFRICSRKKVQARELKASSRTSTAKLPIFTFHEELARRFEHFRVFTGVPQFDINPLNKKGF